MVNQDFEKFRKLQKEHKATYIGSTSDEHRKHNTTDTDYNNQEDTGKSVGATGRDIQ